MSRLDVAYGVLTGFNVTTYPALPSGLSPEDQKKILINNQNFNDVSSEE